MAVGCVKRTIGNGNAVRFTHPTKGDEPMNDR
jgi:hypothetical protein